MFKNILSLALSLFLLHTAKAEKRDTISYFLKNSGQKVLSKNNADYYRLILPPDTNVDKDLYRVFDYYVDGKLKMAATSLTSTINLVLDGPCINFFANGKRKSIAQFKNGILVGSITGYYPNGKLYDILKIEDLYNRYYRYYNGYFPDPRYDYKMKVVEMRDSTGKLLAANGTGHAIIFDEDFKTILQEGDIHDDKKEGEWKGKFADSAEYVCTFHKDVLKSGVTYTTSGNRYNFKQVDTKAVFSDGPDAFTLFVKKNIQYPESAKKRKIEGIVTVGFYVETNGTLSEIEISRGIFKSLDDEAIRVISLCPLWNPATRFGIPIRTHVIVPVDFYNL